MSKDEISVARCEVVEQAIAAVSKSWLPHLGHLECPILCACELSFPSSAELRCCLWPSGTASLPVSGTKPAGCYARVLTSGGH